MSANHQFLNPPSFIKVGNFDFYHEHYQAIRKELEQLLKAHKAGEALFDVITKLEPYVQTYKLDYVQGQQAAAFALKVTNYVAAKYKEINNPDLTPEQKGDLASDAIAAINALITQVKENPKVYGSMGESVITQLIATTNLKKDKLGYIPGEQFWKLKAYWEKSWEMTNPSSKTRGPGISLNAPIMQAFTAAQNQAQSEAAYLQSEEKIANEDYQKFAAAMHDTGSDFINIEKATTTAMQSASN